MVKKIIIFALFFGLGGLFAADKEALAFDPGYIFWPSCDAIANVVSTGTGGLKGTIDPAGTGTCPVGVGQQLLSCKQPLANPIGWLTSHGADPTIATILAYITGVPGWVAIITNNAALPAYVCRGSPPAANLPSQVSTEIGVLNAAPDKLILSLVRIFSGLAGGISLLLMLSGAAKYLTSSGNPEALEEAKGIITSALGGFLLVFLSVFLLRFIGIDVLGIPGLSPQNGGFVTP